MEQGMQEYLKLIAIQTKIANYREFDKTKEETENALRKNFDFSPEEAKQMVDRFWDAEKQQCFGGEDEGYIAKKERLLQEREQKIREYDLAIRVLEDAINGFSSKVIANKNGISLDKVQEILNK